MWQNVQLIHYSSTGLLLKEFYSILEAHLFWTGFTPQETDQCVGFSNADWGGDQTDRKSMSGYLFCISGGSVSWRNKKQSCVALSTTEAEYVALAAATQEALWMRQLISEMKAEHPKSIMIHEDNQSAISMTRNPQFHGRSKHISIKYHFV